MLDESELVYQLESFVSSVYSSDSSDSSDSDF